MFVSLVLGATALLSPIQQDTTVPVSTGTRLELSTHSGQIMVRTWSRNAIQVSADLGSRARLEVDVSGGVARVGQSSRHGDDDATDYRLTVPVWMDLDLSTVEDGDITVEGTQGRVTASSVEGNVTVRGGRDFVSVHTVEGEATVDGVTGRLEVNSVDGGITLTNIRGEIMAETVDGDITMDHVESADVEANTVDGNILYRGPINRQGRYRLGSHDGDITIEAPEVNAVFSIDTYEGEFIPCGFEVTLGNSGDHSRKRMRFTVGTGSARIDLESFDGNVYLTKPGCR
ncbi:MAG: DUF4097 family beta strand repeat-containing protein [Gemmatimonadota bacterium]